MQVPVTDIFNGRSKTLQIPIDTCENCRVLSRLAFLCELNPNVSEF